MKAALFSKKLMFVGGTVAGLLALTATSASASAYYGGDTVSQNCHAYIIGSGSSSNWAIGVVSGNVNCEVRLWQRNVNTGGQTSTAWGYGQTTALYHNDGVHQLRVELYDGVSGADGFGVWVG
ncbi:hypothetical protein ABH931_004843 [Streptacidiphilus sp. MAP12-33]|uniref:hypothetical protein n=1 Tax=Streptacidiphilus sp. MAP12-33 TaxID=3156266 RepID=UPI003512C07C